MLHIGIIGTGGISRMHARGIGAHRDSMRVRAVCDIDQDRAASFAAEFGVDTVYSDYRNLLADPGVDAVLVLLPHNLHREACVEAAAAGKHILVDKPIARTVAEGQPIVNAAAASGVTLMVGFNQRFMPIHRKIKEILDAGGLGDLTAVRIDHHQDFRRPEGHWWRSKEAVGGGCVIGSGIHRLDLLRWFVGEPQSVYALSVDGPQRLEAELIAAATIRFKEGAVGEFFCNWGVPTAFRVPHLREGLSLFGTEGSLVIHNDELYHFAASDEAPEEGAGAEPVRLDPSAYESMWQHFARCVRTAARPETSGAEGLRTLEFVEAIYRSIASGAAVDMEALV